MQAFFSFFGPNILAFIIQPLRRTRVLKCYLHPFLSARPERISVYYERSSAIKEKRTKEIKEPGTKDTRNFSLFSSVSSVFLPSGCSLWFKNKYLNVWMKRTTKKYRSLAQRTQRNLPLFLIRVLCVSSSGCSLWLKKEFTVSSSTGLPFFLCSCLHQRFFSLFPSTISLMPARPGQYKSLPPHHSDNVPSGTPG